jgi:glutathione reductase (NADPH)
VGDLCGRAQLTPVAIAAARRLMDRLFGGREGARLDYDDIPTVVFSHPPIGKVGLTEEEARAAHGDAVRVHRAGFRPMLHALADSPQRSLFKLVCVADGDGAGVAPAQQRVVGIHLLGEAADEMLQGFAVALKRGITLADLHDTVAIHPTSAEEVVLMG